ncbi:hypothetical protein [Persicobacter diffluens]|uniref:Uncharacterized protein n=1 Tax=Persicobacter diffluens TaxID=981 RepID=A0AAN5ANM9_9BACT|nr:hypothetical protein PEDI_55140 [Persicobacter diffluens]
MNPAITTATKAITSDTGLKVMKYVLLAGVGIAVYYVVDRQFKKSKAVQAANQFGVQSDKGMSTSYASRLFAAMYPSSFTWFWDGTDEAEIFRVMHDMKKNNISMASVNNAYRALYQRNVVQDLTEELSGADLMKLNQILAA